MTRGAVGPGGATAQLWSHRDRRTPAVTAAVALTGVPVVVIEDAARVSFVLSCEFEALLEGMPERVRQLRSVLEDHPERCVHSVRGPVMWSETITARANSLGDEDVFVCRSVRRTFECAENRLLVWLLERGVSAGRALRRPSGGSGIAEWMQPGELRRAEELSATARTWRGNPRLTGITARVPNRIELNRMRHARTFGADSAVLLAARARARAPFTAEEVASLCDDSTSTMHAQALEAFRNAGGSGFTFACSRYTLSCNGITWRHPCLFGA